MVVEKITEKKTKLRLVLGNAYLVPVLSHKTTHTHTHTKSFLFLLAFWGTCCCAFASVQFPNLG